MSPHSHSARHVDADGSPATKLVPAEDYVVSVAIAREGPFSQYAHAPVYAKPLEESWFAVLGEVCATLRAPPCDQSLAQAASGELIALKRIPSVKGKTHVALSFTAPEVRPSPIPWLETRTLMCHRALARTTWWST